MFVYGFSAFLLLALLGSVTLASLHKITYTKIDARIKHLSESNDQNKNQITALVSKQTQLNSKLGSLAQNIRKISAEEKALSEKELKNSNKLMQLNEDLQKVKRRGLDLFNSGKHFDCFS